MKQHLLSLAMMFAAATAALASVHASAKADSFYIVTSVNSDEELKKSSLDDIRRIFIGQRTHLESGNRIFPVHSDLSRPEVKAFLDKVTKMDSEAFSSYWRRRLFSGRGYPPKKVKSDTDVLDYVRERKNAIGIIGMPPSGQDLVTLPTQKKVSEWNQN